MQKKEDSITYILTLRLDSESQDFFNALREKHFPVERNYLKAHLTLFHKLPDTAHTFAVLREITQEPFDMRVTGLRHLGAGVAYQFESDKLQRLHQALRAAFANELIAQDQQRFMPHVTVQNKVTPAASKELLQALREGFKPFTVRATGMDLWIYQGGPWAYKAGFPFVNQD
ncbi:2'-5' RNA ligase family protein [Sphingobacterium oryzagri]|uniref:2'-5' RNA ligase family protein n=1 Tax=Sphingobacterium oryzagri TaxID=3025669 RepID=A0ABY7WK45_9SPHI|nr:2'-5' RNA ligase family protein [Sphingobacterium sp. KACC 22765]WDF68665.1 2'-5' RNA ligase family protein [Sphingobacterium sp. KACC 22765]